MIVSFTCRCVGVDPDRSCRCCCRGPVVSLGSTAIFTESGSCCPSSRSNLESSNSHVANDSSKMFVSNVGFSSLVSSQLTLCLGELRIYDEDVVDRSQSRCCVGIVCKQLLLSLLWCWWGCTWFVRVSLHPRLSLLQLAVVRLWVLLLLSLMLVVALCMHCPWVPCTQWTCISTLYMFHSHHCRMVASACTCWCLSSLLVCLWWLLLLELLLLYLLPL